MSDQLNMFELSVLRATAASSSTKNMYGRVQKEIGVDQAEANEIATTPSGRRYSVWKRKMRWVQQTLKHKDYVSKTKSGWRLTGKGRRCLTHRTSGMRVAFITKSGLALWGNSELCSGLFEGEVDLIITSPEYPLKKQREYGDSKSEQEYLDTLTRQIEKWIPMLTPTGSIVLNLGDTFNDKGRVQSLYKSKLLITLHEKLGLSLLQEFSWFNPTKLPNPSYSVSKARTHCVPVLESFYWLSPNPRNVKSDNRNVLHEYSEGHAKVMASAKLVGNRKTRPSTNSVNDVSMHKDNGGSIPGALIYGTPEGANSAYGRYCEENDLPVHPARFPTNVVSFFIKLLTDADDLVFDPFGGSCKTGAEAESLGRHWACADRVLEYLLGGAGRFSNPSIQI